MPAEQLSSAHTSTPWVFVIGHTIAQETHHQAAELGAQQHRHEQAQSVHTAARGSPMTRRAEFGRRLFVGLLWRARSGATTRMPDIQTERTMRHSDICLVAPRPGKKSKTWPGMNIPVPQQRRGARSSPRQRINRRNHRRVKASGNSGVYVRRV